MTLKLENELLLRTEANQKRASNPYSSAWVSASAGSGKTKVLTDRVLNLLLNGVEPEKILCLTFTRAAAAEMAQRINNELGHWAISDDEELRIQLDSISSKRFGPTQFKLARSLLARVLDTPGGLKIMTIHGFCQSILQRFPIESGVPPNFSVIDDNDSKDLLREVLLELMTKDYPEDSSLGLAIFFIASRIHETSFIDLMSELTDNRVKIEEHIKKYGSVESLLKETKRTLGLNPGDTPETILTEACKDKKINRDGLTRAISILSEGKPTDRDRASKIKKWIDDPENRKQVFNDYKNAYLTKNNNIRVTLITQGALSEDPIIINVLNEEAARVQKVCRKIKSANIASSTSAIVRVAEAIIDSYSRNKSIRGMLDYDDLIVKTRELLDTEGNASWVLYKLDGGIDHILIDEAQDTNPDQWRVIAAITDEFFTGFSSRDEKLENTILPKRSIFAVGDTKQSIYSFLGAKPEAFEKMREYFQKNAEDSKYDWGNIQIDVSFRSTSPILKVVDEVFSQELAKNGVVGDKTTLKHYPVRAGSSGTVELWSLIKSEGLSSPEHWKPPLERVSYSDGRERLAGLVARRIASWLNDDELLISQNRPIEPSDILVLVQRRGRFVNTLVRSLKNLGVPVAGLDRMILTEQMAVMDLIAIGQFLLLPKDDLTLATVLKGPLIGLKEDELFHLAYLRKESLWEELKCKQNNNPSYTRAFTYLSDLLDQANNLLPYELYSRVLNQGGRKLILSQLGPEAADPIDEFLSLCLDFEKNNTPSLQSFIDWINAGKAEVKRDLDQGNDTVRIMTVHGAKGLQAPIDILPDTVQVPTSSSGLLWSEDNNTFLWAPKAEDRDEISDQAVEYAKRSQSGEYRRLLYVAMTRARDRLYVCGWERPRREAQKDCWYKLIFEAMKIIGRETTSEFLENDSEIIDSKILHISSPQDVKPGASPERLEGLVFRPLPAWSYSNPSPEARSTQYRTPSAVGLDLPVSSPLEIEDDMNRFKRGKIIHHLLQWLPDLPVSSHITRVEKYLSLPSFSLSIDEKRKLSEEIFSVLNNKVFFDLFSGDSLAEVPITGNMASPDGNKQVITGQIDRLVIDEYVLSIIDYKTNRQVPNTPEETDSKYLMQMGAYRKILKNVYPEKSIKCYLLWTNGPHLMELPDELLDEYLENWIATDFE